MGAYDSSQGVALPWSPMVKRGETARKDGPDAGPGPLLWARQDVSETSSLDAGSRSRAPSRRLTRRGSYPRHRDGPQGSSVPGYGCEERGSNPHTLRYQILSLVRLPVPPPSPGRLQDTRYGLTSTSGAGPGTLFS